MIAERESQPQKESSIYLRSIPPTRDNRKNKSTGFWLKNRFKGVIYFKAMMDVFQIPEN